MRDFFIRALEIVINIVVALMTLGLVLASLAAMLGMGDFAYMMTGFTGGGLVLGLAILVFGGLYLILIAGFLYLGLGIYQNTRRTAQALEEMARRG